MDVKWSNLVNNGPKNRYVCYGSNYLCFFSGTYKQLLYEHGAILLQGFPLGEPKKYKKFLKHLDGVTQMFYSKAGGVRHAVEELVIFEKKIIRLFPIAMIKHSNHLVSSKIVIFRQQFRSSSSTFLGLCSQWLFQRRLDWTTQWNVARAKLSKDSMSSLSGFVTLATIDF